jgi:hypothetical protein
MEQDLLGVEAQEAGEGWDEDAAGPEGWAASEPVPARAENASAPNAEPPFLTRGAYPVIR